VSAAVRAVRWRVTVYVDGAVGIADKALWGIYWATDREIAEDMYARDSGYSSMRGLLADQLRPARVETIEVRS
jgi:hypothetical protein